MRAVPRSTPGALAPVRVLVSRSILAYSTPSAPLIGTSRFRCLALYTLCPRCAFPPRRPISGSVLSLLILSRHVVLYDYGKFGGCLHPVPSPPTLAFASFRQTRPLPRNPANPFPAGQSFSKLYGSLALQPVELLAPLTDLTRLSPSQRGLLLPGFRRLGHPHRRRI
jgi:hypothetical protein